MFPFSEYVFELTAPRDASCVLADPAFLSQSFIVRYCKQESVGPSNSFQKFANKIPKAVFDCNIGVPDILSLTVGDLSRR